jgi:septal ring factor EnvC (AmiA/AmiB activator)
MNLYKLKSNDIRPIWTLLVFFLFFNGLSQTKQSLENKKKKLNEEITQINSLLNETKVGKKTSLNHLVAINQKISIREELISAIVAEINKLNREIKQNEKEISKLKENLAKLKSDYARMIYFAQRNQDSYSRLIFIFAAGDFNQAYMRLKYFQQYSQFRKQQAEEILKAQTLLIAKINELKDKRHEKNVLLGAEEEEKGNLSKEKQDQEVVLTELQNKEKELKEELEKKKRDAENLQLQIKKLIADEIKRKAEEAAKAAKAEALAAKKANEKKNAKTNKPKDNKEVKDVKKESHVIPEMSEESIELSNDFANNRGKLPWPVTKGYVCEKYGEHEHPAIKGFMVVNNGLEICTSMGAQARAVFAGEVTAISSSPTGGKLVIIRHGEYYTVYSNISDLTVKTGDKISVKQSIGTIMHNDDEGKSSINFQVWKAQKTMDPSHWLLSR